RRLGPPELPVRLAEPVAGLEHDVFLLTAARRLLEGLRGIVVLGLGDARLTALERRRGDPEERADAGERRGLGEHSGGLRGPRRAQASRPPALFAGARLPVARRRSPELALDGLGALARPVAQRRVRAPANDRLVRGEGAAQVLELLSRQPEAGERPVADPGLDVLHAADGLERLGGGAVAAELDLGLAGEQERLGTHPAVAALRRRLGLRRGVLPVLALERGVRQVERRARRERVVGKLLPETAPRRHLIARPCESARDRARVVEPLGRRRRLVHQRLVGGPE